MFEVLSKKQIRGQSVNINPKLIKVKNLTEEMRVSVAINGFLPPIQDQLKLKDMKTMKDLELWSRRIEKMSFIKKCSTSPSVNVVDGDSYVDNQLEVNAFYSGYQGWSKQQGQNGQWGMGTGSNHFHGYNNSTGAGRGRGSHYQHKQAAGRPGMQFDETICCTNCIGNHFASGCPKIKR
jgi:hypothetical protein